MAGYAISAKATKIYLLDDGRWWPVADKRVKLFPTKEAAEQHAATLKLATQIVELQGGGAK